MGDLLALGSVAILIKAADHSLHDMQYVSVNLFSLVRRRFVVNMHVSSIVVPVTSPREIFIQFLVLETCLNIKYYGVLSMSYAAHS